MYNEFICSIILLKGFSLKLFLLQLLYIFIKQMQVFLFRVCFSILLFYKVLALIYMCVNPNSVEIGLIYYWIIGWKCLNISSFNFCWKMIHPTPQIPTVNLQQIFSFLHQLRFVYFNIFYSSIIYGLFYSIFMANITTKAPPIGISGLWADATFSFQIFIVCHMIKSTIKTFKIWYIVNFSFWKMSFLPPLLWHLQLGNHKQILWINSYFHHYDNFFLWLKIPFLDSI